MCVKAQTGRPLNPDGDGELLIDALGEDGMPVRVEVDAQGPRNLVLGIVQGVHR